MQTEIKKWGNSAAIRLPSAMLGQLNLAVGAPVEVKTEDGRIIIEPTGKSKYLLEDLVAGITKENCHEQVDWGAPIGRELTF